ncbi:hypothetical protein H671_6g16939 [Cricetulus griseus]|nr:hypothetical protein H671_6g16939 [Cricetulus griseus]
MNQRPLWSEKQDLYHIHKVYSTVFYLYFSCVGIFMAYYDYINGFSYVEPSLHYWGKANLIMVDDISDAFLDSICQYFVEYF